MKDPKNMTSAEKFHYIFENQNDYYVANRFGWFESLLSNIRTLIEDGQRLKNAYPVITKINHMRLQS